MTVAELMKKLLVISYWLLVMVARGDCPDYRRCYVPQEDCRVTYIPGVGYYEVCGYFPYYAQPDYRPHWAHDSYFWELERAKH